MILPSPSRAAAHSSLLAVVLLVSSLVFPRAAATQDAPAPAPGAAGSAEGDASSASPEEHGARKKKQADAQGSKEPEAQAGTEAATAEYSVTPAQPDQAKFGTVAQLGAGSGVQVAQICTNCNQASLTVNGVTGTEHVRVTFDGVPAVGGLATVYALSQFPAELVGYTHVERSPGSVLTGSGGMGGEVAFHSAERTSKQKSYLRIETGDWATHSLKLGGADRWGPVGALVFVQGTTGNAVDANHDGANEIGGFHRFTYHGILDFHLNERQTIGVNYLFYGEDQIAGPGRPQAIINRFADENVFFNWHQYGVSWERDGDDGSQVRFEASSSRRFQQQVSVPATNAYLKVQDERQFARVEGRIPLGKSGMLTSGLGYQGTLLWVFNDDAVSERFVDDGLHHWELYSQYQGSVGSHWDYDVGARYDDFTVFGKTRTWDYEDWRVDPDRPSHFVLPRAQAHYRPNGKVVLGLAAGRFAVGPTPVFERTCCGAQFKRAITLDPEKSMSYQVQVELHPTRDMRLTTTFFRTDFTDYIQRDVEKSTLGVPTYSNDNIPHARIAGADVVHDMRFAGNAYNVGWTYTYTSPEDGQGHDLPYLARHSASGYFRYDDERRGTKVSLDVQWSGSVRHFQLSTQRLPDVPPVGFLESPAFTTANVSFEQRIGKKGWSVEAGVTNLGDYVMSDLDRADRNGNGVDDIYERCYDWGPISGRYGWFAFKWSR